MHYAIAVAFIPASSSDTNPEAPAVYVLESDYSMCVVNSRHDFPRIHDAKWIQRSFDLPHYIDGFPLLRFEMFEFAVANAVLAGTGTAYRQGSFNQPVINTVCSRLLAL